MTEPLAALAPTGPVARAAALTCVDYARRHHPRQAAAVAAELLDMLGLTPPSEPDLPPHPPPTVLLDPLDDAWLRATGQTRCPPATRAVLTALHRHGPAVGSRVAARAGINRTHALEKVLPRLRDLGQVSSRRLTCRGHGVEWSLTDAGDRLAYLADRSMP